MGPDLVSTVEDDLGGEHLIFAFAFFIFLALTSITVMNMLIGVLVEEVSAISMVEKEQMDAHFVRGYFEIFLHTRIDIEQEISKQKFQELMEDPEALQTLH